MKIMKGTRNHLELLNRLDGLRPGPSGTWRAKCPAHGSRRQSLKITDVEDRLLIKCFAGCSAAQILDAVGLSLSDLFDKPLYTGPTRNRIRVDYREVLRTIGSDLTLVVIVLQDFEKTGMLDDQDRRAILHAVSFIMDAMEVAQ